jgi:hypothetical protein
MTMATKSDSTGAIQSESSGMSRDEIRAGTSLASIFALRMLGLFLMSPVFAIYAKGLSGGDNADGGYCHGHVQSGAGIFPDSLWHGI